MLDIMIETNLQTFRDCLRAPIPEISIAAAMLNDAVSAHLQGQHQRTRELLTSSNLSAVRDWTESLWGKNSQFAPQIPSSITKARNNAVRAVLRMPSTSVKAALHARDGYHCRFCGIPVIRTEVRRRLVALYPELRLWGRTNPEQHAALQCMWAQYDHLVPHALCGDNTIENLLITCAPCNYGRMDFTLEEAGLNNPFDRAPIQDDWDGLERLLLTTYQPRSQPYLV